MSKRESNPEPPKFVAYRKFNLNEEVSDIVTGFRGIIMGITEYNTGCIQYGVCPRKLEKDNKLPEWIWFDGSRLKFHGEGINIKPVIGGPHPTAPSM